jgi:O-antigen ligase
VEARFREFKEVNNEIYETPLFGQGFRKEISYYNNTRKSNSVVSFIHNGYLNLAHKTGIPMAILFYFVVLLFNIRGYVVAWRLKRYCSKNHLNSKDQHYFFTALAIGSSLTITMLLITNMVTSSFFFRDGLIITAFVFAFISIAERKYNEIKNIVT